MLSSGLTSALQNDDSTKNMTSICHSFTALMLSVVSDCSEMILPCCEGGGHAQTDQSTRRWRITGDLLI
jgi:hypothetical protein